MLQLLYGSRFGRCSRIDKQALLFVAANEKRYFNTTVRCSLAPCEIGFKSFF